MKIDIHTHYGVIPGGYQMPLDRQLQAMEQYGIDYALISNIECGAYHEGIDGNVKMLDMVRENKDKLGCMLWCCENLTEEEKVLFEELYLKNRDIVKGLKIHPDISGKRADDECFAFFYQLAKEYSLPVLLHTKDSPYSKIEYVVNVAKRYPDIILILGHMDIGSDGQEALAAVCEYDNLYGDTTWVKLEVVKQAATMGIAHKIMFGTDSPISGKDCYADAYYIDYYTLEDDYMVGVMYENAEEIFKLKGSRR